MMKAMIMAAGVGSRLMPMTADIPKPMIPIANRPLMSNTVQVLKEHGFSSIIANLHYHSDIISDFFGDGRKFGVDIRYSYEEELMGTAGGVKRCEWFLDDTFVIVSGDALTDMDLTALLKAHRAKGALASIALTEVQDVQNFGVVVTDENGLIRSFQEKPRPELALSRMVNTGIYVFEPEIFQQIPAGQFFDFGKQVFPHLVEIGAPFYGIHMANYWCDVGNIDTYRTAHADILAGRVRVQSSGKLINLENGGRLLMGEGTQVGNDVSFRGSVTIGPGCRIGDDVNIRDSVIWNDTIIGNQASIHEAVIGANCQINSGLKVDAGAVIASNSRI